MATVGKLGEDVEDQSVSSTESGRYLSIDHLQTKLTLMVLAQHSSLAYTSWAYSEGEHVFRCTAPVADTIRSAFFDYGKDSKTCFYGADVFVSGLFVSPALRKNWLTRFIRDRLRMLILRRPLAESLPDLTPY